MSGFLSVFSLDTFIFALPRFTHRRLLRRLPVLLPLPLVLGAFIPLLHFPPASSSFPRRLRPRFVARGPAVLPAILCPLLLDFPLFHITGPGVRRSNFSAASAVTVAFSSILTTLRFNPPGSPSSALFLAHLPLKPALSRDLPVETVCFADLPLISRLPG